jgi:hypothetical protein
MALKTENITFDATDREGLASWWARALDGRVNPIAPPFFVVVSRNDGPGLAFIGGRSTRRSAASENSVFGPLTMHSAAGRTRTDARARSRLCSTVARTRGPK